MKPVAIFRHVFQEGPGFLTDFFDAKGIPWLLIALDAGDAVPGKVSAYSGLVFMGGPMSVNEDLPWIAQELDLIREAIAVDLPLLGHCLGAQLLACALGGKVSCNPIKEIGWGRVSVADNAVARNWFCDISTFDAFHWHGETFSLPPGADHLLSSAHCDNQAFAIGKHLGLQCHIEMTAKMLPVWCEMGANEIAAAITRTAVQTADQMQAQIEKIAPLHQVATRLYARWSAGLDSPHRAS
ncbi:MAG: type 1 glutamine amidotransferase [Gallionella sp.]